MRMLGLFMILPVFALYAHDLAGSTPLLVGLAIGAYGLTQALLQIPFGLLSDRIGRKPVIYAGLAIFAVGSVVAAGADSIQGVIIGRALAGQRRHRRGHHRAGRGPDAGDRCARAPWRPSASASPCPSPPRWCSGRWSAT
jgi:hypothetical protein